MRAAGNLAKGLFEQEKVEELLKQKVFILRETKNKKKKVLIVFRFLRRRLLCSHVALNKHQSLRFASCIQPAVNDCFRGGLYIDELISQPREELVSFVIYGSKEPFGVGLLEAISR